MSSVGVSNRWKPLASLKAPYVHREGPLDHAAFRELLHYERLRTDRIGSRFTIVVISFDYEHATRYTMRRFLATLFLNMRDTDQSGWMSEQRLGILLPDTTVSGAQMFMKKIHDTTSEFNLIDSVIISMYPRVGNMKLVTDDGDDPPDYFSTYESRTEDLYILPAPKWKRAVDVVGSVLGLFLLSPLFLVIGGYIFAVSPGRIMHREDRVGRGGRVFTMLKFRTRKTDGSSGSYSRDLLDFIKDGDAVFSHGMDEGESIPAGRVIRALCLDELPQLFNVLDGEMSLVGPSPCRPYEAGLYQHWNKRSFDFTPGITGLWQVSGKNRLSFNEKIRLDIRYGEGISFFRDLWILAVTVPSIWLGIVKDIRDRFVEKRKGNEDEGPSDAAPVDE